MFFSSQILTWMNWMVMADLPTPPPPTTANLYVCGLPACAPPPDDWLYRDISNLNRFFFVCERGFSGRGHNNPLSFVSFYSNLRFGFCELRIFSRSLFVVWTITIFKSKIIYTYIYILRGHTSRINIQTETKSSCLYSRTHTYTQLLINSHAQPEVTFKIKKKHSAAF